jgi:hypothetical protein
VEDDLSGKGPQWKMTLFPGREPLRKMTSVEDDLIGRRPQWKTTSVEDDLSGRQP